MTGRNIFNEIRFITEDTRIQKSKCVFISHKKEDADFCRAIANYLMSEGIDVYFDEYDKSINLSKPETVVRSIERGLLASSYVLCVATANTFKSRWVPWELGNGFSKRLPLFVLKSKTLPVTEKVPEYMCVATYLTGWSDLKKIIDTLPNHRGLNESVRAFSSTHPLHGYINF